LESKVLYFSTPKNKLPKNFPNIFTKKGELFSSPSIRGVIKQIQGEENLKKLLYRL